MNLKANCLYKVTWIDAFSSTEWTTRDDLDRDIKDAEDKPSVCYGLFIKSTKRFYLFTSGYNTDKELFNCFSIPKGWIVSIKQIKL